MLRVFMWVFAVVLYNLGCECVCVCVPSALPVVSVTSNDANRVQVMCSLSI